MTLTIHVLPRFPHQLPPLPGPTEIDPGIAATDPNLGGFVIPDFKPQPTAFLQPEWSLAATHEAVAATAADGTVSATFDVDALRPTGERGPPERAHGFNARTGRS